MNIIAGSGFRENVELLKQQQVIKEMAGGMLSVPRANWLNSDGEPLWDFTQAANAEYKRRLPRPEADMSRFIGSVANAVAELVTHRFEARQVGYRWRVWDLINDVDQDPTLEQDEAEARRIADALNAR